MDAIQQFFIALIGIIFLVILYSFIGSCFEHIHFHYIHQTGVGIIVGVIFGVIVFWLNDFSEFQFNEQFFFLALLPPMIFSGGYNLKKKEFFKNIKYILIFGLIGTVASFFIIFGLTYLINSLNLISVVGDAQNVVLTTALMIKFSATISATDSVAALTLIKPKEQPKLFSVIFGQGMINDAVAIILFKVVGGVFEDSVHMGESLSETSISASTIGLIVWQFIYTVILSLAIGVVIAMMSTLIFKRFRFLSQAVTEVVIVYLFGTLSYLIAQVSNMSGVLAVLVAGITMAHFNFYNLSTPGQVATGVTFHSIAFISQAVVFIYLGLSFMYYLTQYHISLSFFGLQLLVCVVSRIISIFGLALVFKVCSKWLLSYSQMAVVSTAGTIRGSVAFALILTVQVPQHATPEQQIAIQVIKSTVLFMVFLTTIVLGGAMPFFIKIFGVSSSPHPQRHSLKVSLLEQATQQFNNMKQGQTPEPEKPKGIFQMIDEVYFKRWFIYDYENRKQQIKRFKKFLKMNSPQYKGALYEEIIQAKIRNTIIGEYEIDRKLGRQTSLLSSHFVGSKFEP